MQEEGLEVPALERRQSLTGLVWLYQAYDQLATCRPAAFAGLLPIPWTAVHEYALAHDYSEEETYLLHGVVSHLDSILIDHEREKSEALRRQKKART